MRLALDDRFGPEDDFRASVAVPRRYLRRDGIMEPLGPNPGIDARLWKYTALYVVAEALIENDLIDADSLTNRFGRLAPPHEWRFKWHRRDRRHNGLHDWLRNEWKTKVLPILESARCLEEMTARHEREGDSHLLATIKSVRFIRDWLWRMSGLLPMETDAKPPSPELVEIAYVLDEAMDRLSEEMARQLIRRSLRPDCSAEDRARIVEALQDVLDKGRLPNATRVLNEELGPPDPIPLFGGRACAANGI